MKAEDSVSFKRILIIGVSPKRRRGLANAFTKILASPKFLAIDPSSQTLPNQQSNWSKIDLLLIDVSIEKKSLYAWFNNYPNKIILPPAIFVSTHASVDDAGSFYRAGAADYVTLDNLKLSRLRRSLSFCTLMLKQKKAPVVNDNAPPSSSAISPRSKAADTPSDFIHTGIMSILARDKVRKDSRETAGVADSPHNINWPFTPESIAQEKARLGGYQILKHLGSGATASIFKAQREADGLCFAMKIFDKDSSDRQGKKRFIRGYELLVDLQDPHVIGIEELVDNYDATYAVLEYFSGGNLQEKIEQTQRMDRGDAIEHAIQIAAGLNAAHNNGVLHRDLKPANIMFREDGSLALADFGSALSKKENSGRLTVAGQLIGTPNYISPERAQGAELDHRSDLYALGAILFEMIEGKRPYVGASEIEVMMAHVRADIPDLANANDPLNPIIKKLLCKNPDGRHASGQDIINELQALPAELQTVVG